MLTGQPMERMSTQFQVTDSNLESGQFEGMGSVFGSLVSSWCPTVLKRGAFTKTLREQAKRVKLLWQHNPDWPLGLPTLLEEVTEGLHVIGKVSQTTLGKDAIILMRDKVIDELSIGFDPIKGGLQELPLSQCIDMGLVTNPTQWVDMEQTDMIRVLGEVRLWEISPVTFAADPMARITEANRRNGLPIETVDEAERLTASLTIFRDLHAGKMLSAKNKTLVQDAVTALQALLTAAEPPASDDDAQALTRDVEQLLLMLSVDARLRGIPVVA